MRKPHIPAAKSSRKIAQLYLAPEVYDLAFSYRRIGQEVGTLLKWYRRHRAKPIPRHVLELAAGPARHARELAGRNCLASALDLSPAMCRFARAQARASHLPLKTYCGSMENIGVPGKFDLILLMLDSASHILSTAVMDAHLQSVSAKLASGGIYVMELAHNSGKSGATPKFSWSVRRGSDRAQVQWGAAGDRRNASTSVTHTTVKIEAHIAGQHIHFAERLRLRHWTPEAMDAAIARRELLETIAKYGNFHANARFNPKSSPRLMYVLRKQRASKALI